MPLFVSILGTRPPGWYDLAVERADAGPKDPKTVYTLKAGETLKIGEDVIVRILGPHKARNGQTNLGFHADRSIGIVREEAIGTKRVCVSHT